MFELNIGTLINTGVALIVLTVLCLIARILLNKPQRVGGAAVLMFIRSFMNLTTQTLGGFVYPHFAFVMSLFLFILTCNWLSILPYAEEPTTDVNTALALGIISFFYKDIWAIMTHGLGAFLHEFIQPIFVMAPINIVGHFSKVISLSFRLFGNIFGGSIIVNLYGNILATSALVQVLGIFSGLNIGVITFFTLFEGLVQAFVFAMLSLTYLAMAIGPQETEIVP